MKPYTYIGITMNYETHHTSRHDSVVYSLAQHSEISDAGGGVGCGGGGGCGSPTGAPQRSNAFAAA